MKEKKGLSEIVAYVMLVIIGISLAILVYGFMVRFLPGREPECPDGISLMVVDYECSANNFNLTVRNTGRFSLDGQIVRVYNDTGHRQEITDQSTRFFGGDKYECGAELNPGEECFPDNEKFTYFPTDINRIEIVPLKIVDGRTTLCDNAKMSQEVEC